METDWGVAVLTWNRRTIALVAGAGILITGAIVWRTDDPEPEIDQDLLRAITPVVDADLPTNRKVIWTIPPDGRWFCAEQAVETRRDGSDVRLGLIAHCSAYARRNDTLVQYGGHSGGLVVTLTPAPDGYRVRDVEVPKDGAGHAESLKRMFTEAGYNEVLQSAGSASPDPAPEARAAFGLPANAPVVLR